MKRQQNQNAPIPTKLRKIHNNESNKRARKLLDMMVMSLGMDELSNSMSGGALQRNDEGANSTGSEPESDNEDDEEEEEADIRNKKYAIIDFIHNPDILLPGVESVTTSLFCCIAVYLNNNKDKTGKKVLWKALELMKPAIINVMKPSKLDGFGSIYPEDDEIFSSIENLYSMGIRIFDQKGWIYRQANKNFEQNAMEIMFRQDHDGERYSIIRNSAALGNRFVCEGCEKVFIYYKNFVDHSNHYCTGISLIDQEITHEYQQGIWRAKLNIIQKLQELNVLILPKHSGPDSPLLCKKFIVFDIESFLNGISDKESMNTPHYRFSTKHKACMICYTNSYDWEIKTFTSEPADPSKFVENFVLSILECQKLVSKSIREEVKIYFQELNSRITAEKLKQRKYWVKRYTKLLDELSSHVDSIPILGYNSSKYDIPVLRSMGLFYYLEKHNGPVFALKKTGSKYLQVSSKHTKWLDFLLFQGAKVSLRQYLKTNQCCDDSDMLKQYFPYGCLVSHKSFDMTLPSFDDFYDSLKKRNQLETEEWTEFVKCWNKSGDKDKAMAEMKLTQMPQSPQQKYTEIREFWEQKGFKTVRDILKDYIRADVVPLAKMIERTLPLYHNASIDILSDFVSLPSFVLHYALKFIPNPKDEFFCLLQKPEREMVNESLIGGPSLIFTRYCKCGKSRIKPHHYQNPPVVKRIIGFDETAMYGGNLAKDQFIGYYATRNVEDGFLPKLMGAKNHDAILYCEYFAFKNGIIDCRHIASGHGLGERWIKISTGLIKVDGYCSFVDPAGNFRNVVLEYHEEGYSHGWCEKCQLKNPALNNNLFYNGKTMLDMYKQTMQRMDEIEKAGFELHYIWQCEWMKIKREDYNFQYFERYHFNLGPNIAQRMLTENEVLDQIFTGEINGFVQLSAKVEDSKMHYFDEYPVRNLFKHAIITRDMLVPKMKSYCEKYNLFETKQKLLVSSFFAYEVVLSTSYIRFLQSLGGIDFWGVKKIIQFRTSPCLEPFIRAQTQRRKEGDRMGNPLIVEHAKAGVNNCFGYTIMDENRRTQTFFKTPSKFRKLIMTQRPIIDKIEVGPPESPDDLIEATVRPTKIKHKTPLQIGAEILQLGKVELLSFAYDVIKANLKPDHYQFLLTDTDSIYLALAEETLEACIKQGREKEWKQIERDRFVDESTPERKLQTKRVPHYWHIEKESNGTLIALSSKLYVLTNDKNETIKSGTKGIQKSLNRDYITSKIFESVLFDKRHGLPTIHNTGFLQKHHEMFTYELLKCNLHAAYGKRPVYDCGVHSYTYINV